MVTEVAIARPLSDIALRDVGRSLMEIDRAMPGPDDVPV